jgi:hypothetical protein
MNPTKIANFRKIHDGRDFPWWRALDEEEARRLRLRLSKKLGEVAPEDGMLLLNTLVQRKGDALGNVEEAASVSWRVELARRGIHVGERVLIDWYRFDRIDEMRLDDLETYFDDVWYGSADDIEVFDESLEWFIVVAHYGEVRLVMT